MNGMIYDLIILAVLLLFALWGMHRGLVLTFFSLVAVLIGIVGAVLVANLWAPAVAGWVQPVLQPTVSSAIEAALPESAEQADLPIDDLIALLQDADLPFGLGDYLEDVLTEDLSLSTQTLVESLSQSLSGQLAQTIAYVGLFLVSFLLILILWMILGRTLDLVARLPGLHFLNKTGGFVLGAAKGMLLLFVCAWLIRWLWIDLIPADALSQSKLLHFFVTFHPLDALTKL